MKKLIALILALVMILSFGVSASAAMSAGQLLALARIIALVNSGGGAMDPNPTINYFALDNDVWQSAVSMADKDVKIVAAKDVEDELSTSELEEFLNQYEAAKAASKAGIGKKLQAAYWYEIPTKNLKNGNNYARFCFTCPGKGVEATLNGEPVELVHYTKGTSYYGKMTGCGVLLIYSNPD